MDVDLNAKFRKAMNYAEYLGFLGGGFVCLFDRWWFVSGSTRVNKEENSTLKFI